MSILKIGLENGEVYLGDPEFSVSGMTDPGKFGLDICLVMAG